MIRIILSYIFSKDQPDTLLYVLVHKSKFSSENFGVEISSGKNSLIQQIKTTPALLVNGVHIIQTIRFDMYSLFTVIEKCIPISSKNIR